MTWKSHSFPEVELKTPKEEKVRKVPQIPANQEQCKADGRSQEQLVTNLH